MTNGITPVPPPRNEPVRSYAPGTPERDPLEQSLQQMLSESIEIPLLIGGVKSGMGLTGCRDIEDLRKKARFLKVTSASLREGHAHDVIITEEAPNYRLD